METIALLDHSFDLSQGSMARIPKRYFRLAVRASIGLVAMAIVGLVACYLAMDGFVRRRAERDTSRALALRTTVGAADASPFRGRLAFRDVRIDSPAGYVGGCMLHVPDAWMDTSLPKLRGDPVRIGVMLLDRPTLVIEAVDGKINLKRMIEQMPPRPKPLMLAIDALTIKDATVLFKAGSLGVAKDVRVPLATFTLHNLGTADADGDGRADGARLGAVMSELLSALAARAGESDRTPEDLRLILKGDWGGAAKAKLVNVLPPAVGQALGGLFAPSNKVKQRPATAPIP